MNDPAVMERVKRVLADVLMLDEGQLQPDSSPDTITAWDSVQHLTLVIALEQEFGVRFAPEEIEEALSVQAIADLIQSKHPRP